MDHLEPLSPTLAEAQPSGSDISAKHRKIRRGTRSCWDCKRRKVRCIFASSTDAVCSNCRRRGSICVSQDLPEALAPARDEQISDRIVRVEELVNSLARQARSTTGPAPTGGSSAQGHLGAVTPSYTGSEVTTAQHNDSRIPQLPSSPPLSQASAPLVARPMTYGPGKHGEITRALLAAFPSFEDVEVMCKTARRQTLYFHLNSCKTYGQLEQEGLTPLALPTSAAELMNSHAHPVFMATNMLMFAFVLQLPVFCKVNSFAESPSKIANRLVEAASNLVTNNDKLYGTMELLQCMLYESQFHKSIGNLRRAWLAGRRALLVGQMMGIHRPGARPAKTIDPNYKIDQHVVWFRIVHADRSLCLLLGFPQGTLDTSMASETALASDAPLGRLERHLTVIASRILERNELGLSDHHFTTTQDIDTELLRVGKTIPTKFWLRSGLSGIENGSEEDFWETERFTSQVFYYNLLNQLHLPYLLRFDDKGQHEYSKVSCVHASREILGLFVTYRTFNKTPVCHRVLDFLALMAATTLLLAHFDSQLHRKANSFLAHQRLSDRAMIEQVLETMDAFCMLNEDVLTGKSTEVLRCLLHVEDDAAGGRSYSARSVHQSGTMPEEEAGDKQEGGYGKSLVLRICIPYFGYIKITGDGAMHQEPDPERLHPAASTADTLHNLIVEHATPQVPGFVEDFTLEQYDVPEMTAGLDDWAFQGVDTALFDSLMSGASTANINGSNAGWNSYV